MNRMLLAASLALVTFPLAAAQPPPVTGKYVRVLLPGRKRILSLAEVQVMSGGENVALKRPVTQSSVGAGGVPERAVDGNTDGTYSKASTTHTDNDGSMDPWWMVELDEPVKIDAIIVYNRKEIDKRILGAVIEILDAEQNTVSRSDPFLKTAPTYYFRDGKLTIPSPEEEALYVKRATWKETAIATFENAHQFDADLHLAALNRRKIEMVAKIAGPFQATGKDRLNIEDKGDSVSVMGKDYPWRVLEGFRPRDGNDLAQMAGLEEGDCAVFRLDLASTGAARVTVLVPHSSRHGTFLHKSRLRNAKLTEQKSQVPFLHPRYREKSRPKRVFSVSAHPNSDNSVYAPVRVSEDGTCYVSVYPNLVGIETGNAAPLPHRGIHTRLYERIGKDFPDLKSQVEMKLEFSDAIWEYAPGSTGNEVAQSWFSGRAQEFLAWHYSQSVNRILAEAPALNQGLSADNAGLLEKHLARVGAMPHATYAQALERFYLAKYAEVLVLDGAELDNAILAVKDQIETFGDAYPNGQRNLMRLLDAKAKVDASFAELNSGATAAALVESVGRLLLDSGRLRDDILIANPLLQTPLIMTRGEIRLNSNWVGKDTYGREVVTLSPANPRGEITRVHLAAQSLNRIDLDRDARRLLLCDNHTIFEINADGSGEPDLIKTADVLVHDAIRLPSGKIIYSDANVEQAIPCVGGNHVGNLHVMDADGKNQRRLCYDQDHNWHPSVMDDGRVMYLRWEYTAIGHYFSRILMTMNPDGTGQVSRYGSNSYWPNSLFWPRRVPGKPSQFIAIVSGHHGVAKRGHLTLFDCRKGTFEADGVVQKIGERGKKIEPVIADKLVNGEYPHYITPFPLGTNAKESGKYFLATGKMNQEDAWGLYLVDIYDNRTLIKKGDFAWARPLAKTQKPPVIPDVVDARKRTAVVSISDIYFGPGLKGIPRGAVKRLRIATPVYRYPGNGRHNSSGAFSAWDLNKIIGTVPVEEDGSASFEAPANTPLFLQPLNAEGQALQVMRTWFVAMPGETVSCIGCHEGKNAAPPPTVGKAMERAPSEIEPWYGEPRGFAFRHEVQPVLDRKCIGCHNGSKRKTRSGLDMPDLRGSEIIADTRFSKAYTDLQRYVRSPGPESDLHMAEPTQWMADTSHLIKILKKGHHNVMLDDEEWDRLFTWVDLYAQYTGRWSESYKVPTPKQIGARAKYLKMYAGIVDEGEEPRPTPAPVQYEEPAPLPKRPPTPVVDGWPFDAVTARQMQADCGLDPKEIALSDSVNMRFVPIPAGRYVMGGGAFGDEPEKSVSIDEPFYMSSTEVTYAQYKLFDETHDNQHIEKHGGNRVELGIFDMNQPQLPAVWVSQEKAKAFCQWLSEKTGMKVSLPTEEQWEWAARAGCSGLNYLSEKEQTRGYNIADTANRRWNHGRYQDGHDDGKPWPAEAKSFVPNAWGLYNMLGNVSEWTASRYVPLAGIGETQGAKGQIPYSVVRGGSWNDTAPLASLPSRWRYMTFQGVQDVGFRVVAHPPRVRAVAPVDTSVLPKGVERVDIFLLMGQSNMKGRGKIPASQTTHSRVLNMNMANDRWYAAKHPLHKAGEPDLIDGSDNAGVGPGLAFARELIKRDQGLMVALIPVAKGGSSIGHWGAKRQFYQQTVRKALKALADFPEGTARIAGALWLQGESDARKNLHATYSGKLDALVARLRADLDQPELPFIACTIGTFIKPQKFPDVAQINTSLLGLPDRVPHAACVDARDLKDGHRGDFLHYNTDAQQTIGRRYAAAYHRLITRP